MSTRSVIRKRTTKSVAYPFTEIVGQEAMKLSLILNVIDPSIGGVLLMGHRGTGKSTAVRALADLLPEIWRVRGCPYHCDPDDAKRLCHQCTEQLATGKKLQRDRSAVPVVDLPLGATEDRVCGSIDIEHALGEGGKRFEPGLLARANRGFLYIDEVNLLEDHLVDLLLDVSITGRNQVERENISIEHPSRFVLIGSGNPEEGELRPQLLDRFGLYVEVTTENDPGRRVEIVEQRDAFERQPENFCAASGNAQKQLRLKVARAARNFPSIRVDRQLLGQIATLCSELKVDGHRGELTIMRAARALAAFAGRKAANEADVRRVTPLALRHRLHRDPLEERASDLKIEQALDRVFGTAKPRRGLADRGVDAPASHGHGVDRETKKPGGGRASTGGNHQKNAEAGNGREPETTVPSPPAVDAKLPDFTVKNPISARATSRTVSRGRQGDFRRRSQSYEGGRYARATTLKHAGASIALLATLRAALLNSGEFSKGDLRYKQFARKDGTLFIFAIDASGSMALNRINEAKGALLRLFAQSYINRDSVAVVTFKGTRAELLLSPSRSMVRARRVLDSLTVGGGTPLSAGLACSLEVARRARSQRSGEIALLLFTDGRANVPLRTTLTEDRCERQQLIEREVVRLGAALRSIDVTTVVVETQQRFTLGDDARALASLLSARHLQLSPGCAVQAFQDLAHCSRDPQESK